MYRLQRRINNLCSLIYKCNVDSHTTQCVLILPYSLADTALVKRLAKAIHKRRLSKRLSLTGLTALIPFLKLELEIDVGNGFAGG